MLSRYTLASTCQNSKLNIGPAVFSHHTPVKHGRSSKIKPTPTLLSRYTLIRTDR